jgi:hypothetical protein
VLSIPKISRIDGISDAGSGYVRLPPTGESAIGLPTPMADELPACGRQTVEREQAREIVCGWVG